MTLESVGAGTALAALLWGVYTSHRGWTNGVAVRRAEFIRSYTSDYYNSDSLPALFLEIDSRRFRFGRSDVGTTLEVDVSRLLDFLNTVGMSVDQGITSLADLRRTTIGYATITTWRDPSVQWFLEHVDGADAADQLDTLAFGYFRQLGQALESRWTPTLRSRMLAFIRGTTPPLPSAARRAPTGRS